MQPLAIVVQNCENTRINSLGFRHLPAGPVIDNNACQNYDTESFLKNSEFIQLKIFTNVFIKPITRPTTYPSTETYFPKVHFSASSPSTASSTMSFLKLRLHSQHSVSVYNFPVLNTRVAHQALHCFFQKLFCKTKETTNKFPGVKTTTTETLMFC